jgi:type I restriction enzyme S subunit
MAQTIYQEWFGKVDKESLPEGWEVTTIENAFETLGGGTPSTKIPDYWEGGNINWYSPNNLTANNAMFIQSSAKQITKKGLDNSSAKMFPPYCVMMTSRATIGVVSINTTEACTNQGFITCIPNEKVSLYQIYFWILNNLDKIDNVASGATFKEITRGNFRKFDFIIPDETTKKKFDKIMLPIGRQIEILLEKNANLRQTRDLLLPRLVSGEIAV